MASAEDIKQHVRRYMIVFGALAVLTVATVGVAYIHMPIIPALIVALIIASIKAGLVATYFMHLIDEQKLIYLTLIITGVLLICMFIIFVSAYYGHAGEYIVP